jgi:hypothetical protein
MDALYSDNIGETQNSANVLSDLTPNGNGGIPPAMSERAAKIEARLDGIDFTLTEIKVDIRDLRAEVGQLRWWILGSIISFIAVVTAVAAFQASWFQNSIAQTKEELRRDTGRLTETLAQTKEELRRDMDRLTEELRRDTDRLTEELRRDTDRQWALMQNAFEKISESAIRAEALRLFQEERQKNPEVREERRKNP